MASGHESTPCETAKALFAVNMGDSGIEGSCAIPSSSAARDGRDALHNSRQVPFQSAREVPRSLSGGSVNYRVAGYLQRLYAAFGSIPAERLDKFSRRLYRAYLDGSQVFVVGNGGSASTASHMVADLRRNAIGVDTRRLRITSLNDNVPLLTALANDVGYEHVFSDQLANVIRSGDLLVVISGSGESGNVLSAIDCARREGANIVGLLGFSGGRAASLCDTAIVVDSDNYGIIEDAHHIISHILVEHLRERLSGGVASRVKVDLSGRLP